MYNVRPWVARRTPSRDIAKIWTFNISLTQVYENIIDKRLFLSHFSSRTSVCNENYRDIDYAIARLINIINCRYSRSPLLNHDQSYILGFWTII